MLLGLLWAFTSLFMSVRVSTVVKGSSFCLRWGLWCPLRVKNVRSSTSSSSCFSSLSGSQRIVTLYADGAVCILGLKRLSVWRKDFLRAIVRRLHTPRWTDKVICGVFRFHLSHESWERLSQLRKLFSLHSRSWFIASLNILSLCLLR